MRHNVLSNTEAELLQEVCKDVQVKPTLIPLEGEKIDDCNEQGARLDISARELWGQMERTFFDVRVTHPNTQSNCSKSLRKIYAKQEKKRRENTIIEYWRWKRQLLYHWFLAYHIWWNES